jgi:hypothetical protein
MSQYILRIDDFSEYKTPDAINKTPDAINKAQYTNIQSLIRYVEDFSECKTPDALANAIESFKPNIHRIESFMFGAHQVDIVHAFHRLLGQVGTNSVQLPIGATLDDVKTIINTLLSHYIAKLPDNILQLVAKYLCQPQPQSVCGLSVPIHHTLDHTQDQPNLNLYMAFHEGTRTICFTPNPDTQANMVPLLSRNLNPIRNVLRLYHILYPETTPHVSYSDHNLIHCPILLDMTNNDNFMLQMSNMPTQPRISSWRNLWEFACQPLLE